IRRAERLRRIHLFLDALCDVHPRTGAVAGPSARLTGATVAAVATPAVAQALSSSAAAATTNTRTSRKKGFGMSSRLDELAQLNQMLEAVASTATSTTSSSRTS